MKSVAVRNIKEARPKKQRRHFTDYILLTIVVGSLVGLAFGVSSDIRHIADTKAQTASVNSEILNLENENESIREIIDSGDYREYIEKIAREQYGYCSPGEDVFYDNLFGE